jgi:hypothetical protein
MYPLHGLREFGNRVTQCLRTSVSPEISCVLKTIGIQGRTHAIRSARETTEK